MNRNTIERQPILAAVSTLASVERGSRVITLKSNQEGDRARIAC